MIVSQGESHDGKQVLVSALSLRTLACLAGSWLIRSGARG